MSEPRRVRVTSPRMRAARRPAARSPLRDIDEQTSIGEVYMRSLIRTQLRLALRVLAAFALVVGGLPLLFALVPGLRALELLGVPVAWLLLGLLVYPLVAAAAWGYVRAAERAERNFSSLVHRR